MKAVLMFPLIMKDKVTRQCPQTTMFEEKGEPKRIRTEVPLLTSLTPYRQAKPAHTSSVQHLGIKIDRTLFRLICSCPDFT